MEKYVAIFRTISWKLHPEVWETSKISEYDNSKSKYDTLGQIFTWEPSLKNSHYDADDFCGSIGLYHTRYFVEKGRKDSHQSEYFASILQPVNFPSENAFIKHTGNKILMNFRFVRKIEEKPSEFIDSSLCGFSDRIFKNHENGIGSMLGGYIVYPLFFKLNVSDFNSYSAKNNLGIIF